MADFEIPPELIAPTLQLVVLSGLDIANSNVHRNVWDGFVKNRKPDRLPLQFEIISTAFEFPKAKPKRTSYELYVPRGVLKRNWMMKHTKVLPAVVVLFMDLDWKDPNWSEKKVECCSKVESLRHSLEGRSSRIAVVLIQTVPPLPPGDDTVAAERATELCSVCDLSPKSLFVLPNTDHLYGYLLRLEHAFHELGQIYYLNEIRRVKTKKDFLNKTGQQPLLCRYQFKLAFFNEMKQDFHSALKHYKQAYAHLLELKVAEAHMVEVKTVAGLLNFKICKLCFFHNTPLDAIAQFRKHIDFFKEWVGPSEIRFEHHAWLSKHFALFGELFDGAIQSGLAAIQTQHPGFYFQSAANQAVERRNAARLVCSDPIYLSASDPLADLSLDRCECYGQRLWRTSLQTIGSGPEALDSAAEQAGMFSLRWKEARVDHTGSYVIPLLNSAMAYFKRYRCPRMRRFVMMRLAEEYFSIADFTKALQLLSHVTWEYRTEKWMILLRAALYLTLKSAYCLANIKEYTAVCLELLSSSLGLASAERQRIQDNLRSLLSGTRPEAEIGVDPAKTEDWMRLWDNELKEKCFCMLQMQNLMSCVGITCHFASDELRADQAVHLTVTVKVDLVYPVDFSKLEVKFTDERYNQMCSVVNSAGELHFESTEEKSFDFKFLLLQPDIDALEVKSVTLHWGHLHSNLYLSLNWEGFVVGRDQGVPVEFLRAVTKRETGRHRVRILPRSAVMSMKFHHDPPALLNETFPVRLTVSNKESLPIQHVRISALFVDEADGSLQSAVVSSDHTKLLESNQSFAVSLPNMESGASADTILYLKCFQIGSKALTVTADYEVVCPSSNRSFVCRHSETLEVQTVQPFSVSTSLLSTRMEMVDRFVLDELSIVMVELKCSSPFPLEIVSTAWQIFPHLEEQPSLESVSCLTNVSLSTDDCATICDAIIPRKCLSEGVGAPIGSLIVKWRRSSNEKGELMSTADSIYPLPSVVTDFCPVLVAASIPAFGTVRTPLNVSYKLSNLTDTVIEIVISMELAEAFMFSGHKQLQVRILPRDSTKMDLLLFPLIAGHVLLPKLKLTSPSYPQELLEKCAQRNVPTTVFMIACQRLESDLETEKGVA